MRQPRQEFWRNIVSETVVIGLRRCTVWGTQRSDTESGYFVQCSEEDCQFSHENRPRCPLHVGMFKESA